MGKIYYLIPDIHRKRFIFKDLIKAILKREVAQYFQKRVFRKHQPVGGIKVMYQHCVMLNDLGFDVSPLIMGEYIGNFFGYNLNLQYIKDVGYQLSDDDIVICPEFMPYLGTKFKGCRRILFNQSQSWRYIDKQLSPEDKGKNYIDLGYDYVINCSEYLSQMLKNHMNIPMHAITNGIDHSKFHRIDERRIKNRVLALSRKNPEDIKIIKDKLKGFDFKFRVVDGLTEDELIDEYQQADIFIATGYPEGFSLPPLEAMSCGCVIVGFTGGGASEFMIDGDTTLVSDDGDCDAVAQKMKKLLIDPELKERIREAGFNKSKEYSLENTKRMLNDFYQMVKSDI